MARSAMFRRLQWMVRVSEEADRRGIDPAEAVELAHGGELWAPTRRRHLKGAGLAAAGMALTPARAFAAPSPTAPKIAVVGAGLAGLACVDTLRSKGVAATLFEASDRAGGRCWTLGGAFGGPVDFPGQVAERGGEFIDTTHGTMRRWATEFGLDLETVEPAGETLYQFGGTLHDEAEVVAEYRLLVDALRDDLRTIGSPTATSFTEADRLLDETDLATYLRTRGAGGLIAAVLEAAYRGEFGLELSEQSALSLLLFIHADRRSKFRPFGVFSDERFHVIGGNQQIVAGLTARNASSLRLGHRLVAVTETSTGKVRLTFETGRRLVEDTFDRVVLAVPFPVLRGVDLSGFPLPTWKRRAIDELRYGTNSKHLIGFTGRPWQEPSVGGNGSIYADLARLQNTWETNQSLGDASRGVLTSFTGGVRGRAIDPRRVDAETAVFLADLDRIVPGASSAVRQNRGRYVAHIENWSRSPYQLGSYTANHPGYFTTICDLEAPPVRALHFAGEHTSSFYEWQGFMEGGALSGIRAAAEVYAAVR